MNATVPRCKYYNAWGMSCDGCPKYFEKQVGINIVKAYVDNCMTVHNLIRRSM